MHSNKRQRLSPDSATLRNDLEPGKTVSTQPHRRTAMRHFTGLLALFAILFGLVGARADTVTQYLTFQAQDQGLWDAGSNRSYAFDLTGNWDAYSFDQSTGIKIPSLGHFSAGASGGADAGRAGLIATAYANSGKVNITYPLTFTLNYPTPSSLSPGQTFTVSSSWSPGTPMATPSLVTKSPSFGVSLNGILEEPNISLDISGRAFGEWIFRDTIFHQSIDFNQTLVDTKDVNPGTKDLFEGILSVAYKQPRINLTGNLVPATFGGPQTDLYGLGATQSADRSNTGFFTLNGNFSNAISFVASKLLGLPHLKFTDTIHASTSAFGYTCGFSGGYDILSLVGSAGVGMEEEVRFHPNPQVTLYLTDSSGTHTVTFPAGGSIQLTMPSDGSSLYINPVVSLDNSFLSRVSAYASAALDFYPFDIVCTLSLPGYTLPTLSYSIPPSHLVSVQSHLGDVYNKTFKLGGFDDQFLSEIVLTPPPPPPPTPLVANDDFYQAGLMAGTNGTVYQVIAGYDGSQPSPLANDSGPAGFHAVAQHWQPEPNDPDTYFDLDEFGHMTFSISQSVVNAQGIGQQQFQYQITDGQGHFATANINITLGSGG